MFDESLEFVDERLRFTVRTFVRHYLQKDHENSYWERQGAGKSTEVVAPKDSLPEGEPGGSLVKVNRKERKKIEKKKKRQEKREKEEEEKKEKEKEGLIDAGDKKEDKEAGRKGKAKEMGELAKLSQGKVGDLAVFMGI